MEGRRDGGQVFIRERKRGREGEKVKKSQRNQILGREEEIKWREEEREWSEENQ